MKRESDKMKINDICRIAGDQYRKNDIMLLFK